MLFNFFSDKKNSKVKYDTFKEGVGEDGFKANQGLLEYIH